MYKKNRESFLEDYHVASSSKARDTAVEFIIALANRKYNLNSVETIKNIFDLLMDILSYVSVFGQRLRYQTLIITETYCFDIFTSDQHVMLFAYKQSLEMLNNTDDDLDDRNQFLEAPFSHIFRWRKHVRSSIDISSYYMRFIVNVEATVVVIILLGPYHGCCSNLQNAKIKREKQFDYSGRSHYLQRAPTVDKFTNKCNIKMKKHC
ncbi:unnamed protein product [Adineta steineri]|uniref:Uncharacterized protein n=1 Tax=Adineta steineri TaxID=433720 RepID=A0A819QHF7_9BILA|nr:unnamed protein product [Adineta steineri]